MASALGSARRLRPGQGWTSESCCSQAPGRGLGLGPQAGWAEERLRVSIIPWALCPVPDGALGTAYIPGDPPGWVGEGGERRRGRDKKGRWGAEGGRAGVRDGSSSWAWLPVHQHMEVPRSYHQREQTPPQSVGLRGWP